MQLSIAPWDGEVAELEVLLSTSESENPLCQIEFSNLDAYQSAKAKKASDKVQRSRLVRVHGASLYSRLRVAAGCTILYPDGRFG